MIALFQFFVALLLSLILTAVFVVYAFVTAPRRPDMSYSYFMIGLAAFFFFLIVIFDFIQNARRDSGFAAVVGHGLKTSLVLFLIPTVGAVVAAFVSNRPGLKELVWAGSGIITFFIILGYEKWSESAASKPSSVHRGTQLRSFADVKSRADKLPATPEGSVFWGGLTLPAEAAEGHFCVVGAPGSGKTVAIRAFMKSVLPRIKRASSQRALVYDAKQDMMSILSGLGLEVDVVTLNPFDRRGAAWDIGADLTSPATAEAVATILIPETQESQPFFTNAARDLVHAVMVSLIRRNPGGWTFRDLLCAVRTRQTLTAVLSRDPDTADVLNGYLSPETTYQNVMTTIRTKMRRFEVVAGLWSKASRAVSLERWARGEFVLVLGNHETARPTIDAINRAVFKRASEILLHAGEVVPGQPGTRRTWIILDELSKAGSMDGLAELLSKGRSKGVRILIGFQDLDALENAFNPKAAREIVAMCDNKAFLRVGSDTTAAWAARVIGEAEFREYTTNRSFGPQDTYTVNEHLQKREAVLASELLNMPLSTNAVVDGVYVTPSVGVYRVQLDYKPHLRDHGPLADFEPRAEADQYMQPWLPEDYARLGLAPPTEPTAPAGGPPVQPTSPVPEDFGRITRD